MAPPRGDCFALSDLAGFTIELATRRSRAPAIADERFATRGPMAAGCCLRAERSPDPGLTFGGGRQHRATAQQKTWLPSLQSWRLTTELYRLGAHPSNLRSMSSTIASSAPERAPVGKLMSPLDLFEGVQVQGVQIVVVLARGEPSGRDLTGGSVTMRARGPRQRRARRLHLAPWPFHVPRYAG